MYLKESMVDRKYNQPGFFTLFIFMAKKNGDF